MITDKNKDFLLSFGPDHEARKSTLNQNFLHYDTRRSVIDSPYFDSSFAEKALTSQSYVMSTHDIIRKHFDRLSEPLQRKLMSDSYQKMTALRNTNQDRYIDPASKDLNFAHVLIGNPNLKDHHISDILDNLKDDKNDFSHFLNIAENHKMSDSTFKKFKDIASKNLYHRVITSALKNSAKNSHRTNEFNAAAEEYHNRPKSILDIKKP